MRVGGTAIAFLMLGACSGYGESTPSSVDASVDSGPDAGDAATDASSSDSGTTKYEAAVLEDSPLLYMHFAETAGLAASARVGAGGSFTPTGIELAKPGAIAGGDSAIGFTDGNGSVTMPPGLDFENAAPFTVEVWMRQPEQSPTGFGFIVDHEVHGANGRKGWVLRAGGTDIGFERWDGSANGSITSAVPARGAWHHVVGTFDGSTMRLYVDTAFVGDRASTLAIEKAETWTIGHQSCCSGTNSFVGDVDELAIYGTALPAARIVAHFQAAK